MLFVLSWLSLICNCWQSYPPLWGTVGVEYFLTRFFYLTFMVSDSQNPTYSTFHRLPCICLRDTCMAASRQDSWSSWPSRPLYHLLDTCLAPGCYLTGTLTHLTVLVTVSAPSWCSCSWDTSVWLFVDRDLDPFDCLGHCIRLPHDVAVSRGSGTHDWLPWHELWPIWLSRSLYPPPWRRCI